MADSTVPAAKAALLTAWQAAGALSGVSTTWGGPTSEEDIPQVGENVWFGEVDQSEEFKVLGAQRIDEDYTIQVFVQVYREADDPQGTETRWWAIRAALVAVVRNDLTIGATLNQWAGTFPTRLPEVAPVGPGWLAKGTVSITCRARI